MIKKFFFFNHRYSYLILISLFFHLLASYFSQGFYEQDEHFSILEPINYKLGKDATLGWDFFLLYDKQWFLSFCYYYLIKFLELFKIYSPFQWSFFIRLTSSLLGWISIICLIHFTQKQLSSEKFIKPLFLISSLFWFYPYIHARAASENISIIFLIFAITLFNFFKRNRKILFICGIFFGLSFITRYTNIIIIGSFGLWTIFFRKTSFLDSVTILTSFTIIFLLSILIDYWGYGILFPRNGLVLFNYLALNYEWSGMGYFNTNTEAWWYNFYFILTEFLPPISIIVIISILLFWIIFPKNMITWLTLPYFIFLCTTPHKETRFLFPILIFSPLFIIMVSEKFYIIKEKLFLKFISYKISKVFLYLLVFTNCFPLLILSITPANNSTLLYKFLYKNEFNIQKIYTLDKIPYRKSDLLINFYRNEDIYFTKITNLNECKKIGNEIKTVNNIKINNYNIETKISELQRYSYPEWEFKYSVICNLSENLQNLKINEKKYFLIHKFKYFDYFNNNSNINCYKIYSTIPNWILSLGINNLLRNLSSWHIFECNKKNN